MATSGSWEIQWSSGTWGGLPKAYKWRGNWNKSGSTIYLSNMALQIVMLNGSSGWGTANDTVTVTGGGQQTVTFTVSGSTSNVVSLNNTSFSVGNTDTSKTIECEIAGEVTGRTTINFDPTQIPPSNLSRTNVEVGTDYVKATVSVSAWNGGTAATRYRSMSVSLAQNTNNCRTGYEYGDTLSSTIVVTNGSAQTGTCTIVPNSRYFLHSTATNGNLTAGDGYTQIVTLPEKPTIFVQSTTKDSVTLEYATTADGGFYDKIIEYSDDQGVTWNTAATITGGSVAQGTFTVTGLTTGEHTLLVRTRTTSGSAGSVPVTFTTAAVRIIASVETTGRECNQLLVSVEGTATEASRMLVSKDGVATENV